MLDTTDESIYHKFVKLGEDVVSYLYPLDNMFSEFTESSVNQCIVDLQRRVKKEKSSIYGYSKGVVCGYINDDNVVKIQHLGALDTKDYNPFMSIVLTDIDIIDNLYLKLTANIGKTPFSFLNISKLSYIGMFDPRGFNVFGKKRLLAIQTFRLVPIEE